MCFDIATTRPRVRFNENHLKCITRWEGRDVITTTYISFQDTGSENQTSSLKLDWVGPIDNRPFTDKLKHFVKKNTYDM